MKTTPAPAPQTLLWTRRRWAATSAQGLLALSAVPWGSAWAGALPPETVARIRQGGVVVAFRHALAPGTYDPPQFRLGDCSTQRNLNDVGRAQARSMGQAFTQAGLAPTQVRSSPWCRCLETARLAFGTAESWDALASPVGSAAAVQAQRIQALTRALAPEVRQLPRVNR